MGEGRGWLCWSGGERVIGGRWFECENCESASAVEKGNDARYVCGSSLLVLVLGLIATLFFPLEHRGRIMFFAETASVEAGEGNGGTGTGGGGRSCP